MQDVGVRDVLDLAQAMGDVLQEEVGSVEGGTDVLLGLLFHVDGAHQRAAAVPELERISLKAVVAPVVEDSPVLIDLLAGLGVSPHVILLVLLLDLPAVQHRVVARR